MTEPGDATTVGSIVAYLRMNRDQWNRDVDATRRDAQRLGATSPDITIRSNAASTIAQLEGVRAAEKGVGKDANDAKPFVVNLWAALAALAPAAIPLAAVTGGALIGLLPVFAAVALGVKGIEAQWKAGALQGTQFAASVNALKGELSTLETTAAGGIMTGVNKALQASGPLFKTVNQDVGVMSTQLGNIVGGAAPALLRILIALNPLFVTFGDLISRGATELEGWAQHSTGVESFVAYVQAELPEVMQFLGQLLVLIGHLAQGMAPFGGAVLMDINLLVRALNAIPIPVLQAAVPLAVSLYVALKAYQGVDLIVNKVTTAVAKLGPAFRGVVLSGLASAAQANATSLAMQAAAAEEAAAIAEAKAAEAAAAAEAAVEIGAAAESAGGAMVAMAEEAAAAAIEFAAALQAEADAAAASAATIADAADVAATDVAAAGEAASVGWTAILGPLAAVGIGVALLTSLFASNNSQAQENAKIQNSYAESLKQSADALAQVNVQTTLKNLKDQGAVTLANQLGISQASLAVSVNGTTAQFNAQIGALQRIADAHKLVDEANLQTGRTLAAQSQANQSPYDAQGRAAVNLITVLNRLHSNLSQAEKDQAALAAAQKAAQVAIDGGSSAVAQQARLYGVTSDAYLTAQQTAEKNTEQTKAQTLAFQLENDATALLNQALQSLAGQNLNNAQAQTTMDQAVLSMTSTLKKNKGALDQHTQAGLDDRQAIEGAVSALRAKAQAETSATGSTEKATTQYRVNATALLEQIGKLDGTKSAAYQYAKQLLAIPPVVKTKVDLQGDAIKKINDAAAALRGLNNKTFRTFLEVQTSVKGQQAMRQQDQGGHQAGRYIPGLGYVPGYASGTMSSPPGWFWVGEHGPELMRFHGGEQVKTTQQSVAFANSAAAATSGKGNGVPVVYVQNPFTGEYLLAQVAQVADSRQADAARSLARQGARSGAGGW